MALKTRFCSVEGRVLAERHLPNLRQQYLTDALGSVTARLDETGGTFSLDATGRYSPYGLGAAPASLGWVGSLGYRPTAKTYASHYVRARHYANGLGNWTTVDPLWPDEPPYGYAGSEPHQEGVPKRHHVSSGPSFEADV